MCGIVGFLGLQSALPRLLSGLRALEYRGYDSSGVALINPSGDHLIVRRVGPVAELEKSCWEISDAAKSACTGIAHTRWATHGGPSLRNAHPHCDSHQRFAIVHNGIIENAESIRSFLGGEGVQCISETDTECLVQLVGYEHHQRGIPVWDAFRAAVLGVKGALAVVMADLHDPNVLYLARRGSPLLVGKSEEGWIIASDPTALAGVADHYMAMEDHHFGRLTPSGFEITTVDEESIAPIFNPLEMNLESISLGIHPDYMHKEIHEQPDALRRCIAGRLVNGHEAAHLEGLRSLEEWLPSLQRLIYFGCGTAWHAGLIGAYLTEELGRIPCRVEYASELRYRNPVIEDGSLAIAISQSGETSDTLEALKEVMRRGAVGFGVVNVVASAIARQTDAGVYIHAGPEVGVASTKAFTGQVTTLALVASELARLRGYGMNTRGLLQQLPTIPEKMERVLAQEEEIAHLTEQFIHHENWLFLGRGINYPVALEGALKLKELAYIHAEGLPAAEIKHGPLALVEEGMPVVVVAPDDETTNKVLSNIHQVRGRGAVVIAIATEGDDRLASAADHVITVPRTHPLLSPLLTVLPLQFMAYHAARMRGHDVDRPRNLAKSVTVE